MKLIRPSRHRNFDYAAVYGIANALMEAACKCHDYDTSDIHSGYDEAMRQAVSVGIAFENWACDKIEFSELTDVYSYHLQDNGGVVFRELLHEKRREFSYLIGREEQVARILKLPIKKKVNHETAKKVQDRSRRI